MAAEDVALTRVEGKIDVLVERIGNLDMKIDMGDRSALQAVQILAETTQRIERTQADHDRMLRGMEALTGRVAHIEARVATNDERLSLLERDRAKLIGFMFGAASIGGVSGGALARLLLGG